MLELEKLRTENIELQKAMRDASFGNKENGDV